MLKGFRDFLMGGDLINIAVGLVMALATFALIESFVSVILTPLVDAIAGEQLFVF